MQNIRFVSKPDFMPVKAIEIIEKTIDVISEMAKPFSHQSSFNDQNKQGVLIVSMSIVDDLDIISKYVIWCIDRGFDVGLDFDQDTIEISWTSFTGNVVGGNDILNLDEIRKITNLIKKQKSGRYHFCPKIGAFYEYRAVVKELEI